MGRNKTIIYILAFLMFASIASAASITGTVQDQDGSPLPAVIRIVGTQTGTQADSQGKFSISSSTLRSGSHQIEVSMISYKTKTVTASTLRPTAVILEINPIELPETEITAPSIKIKAQIQGDKFNRIYGTPNLPEVTNPNQEISVSPQDTISFDASKTNKDSRYFTWYILNKLNYDTISTQSQQELLSNIASFSKSTTQFKHSFTSSFEEGEHAVVLQLQDVENDKYYFDVIYIKSSQTIEPQIISPTTQIPQITQQPIVQQSSLISNLYCIQSIEPTVCNPTNPKDCVANPFYNNSRFNNKVYFNNKPASSITGAAINEFQLFKQNECISSQPNRIKIYSCGEPEEVDCLQGAQCITENEIGMCKKLESIEQEFIKIKERAKRELETNGITPEQREAYKPGISELLYRGIVPSEYETGEKIKEFISKLVNERGKARKEREDAWKFYLGLPQEYDTFGISEYRPGKGVENKYYYKINQYTPGFKRFLKRDKDAIGRYKDAIEHYEDRTRKIPSYVTKQGLYGSMESLITLEKLIKFIDESGNNLIIGGTLGMEFLTISEERGFDGEIWGTDELIMVNYKLSRGQDEKGYYISYYDIWNLEGSTEGEEGLLGKPFEIYDRIYYNPETFEIIDEE